MKKFILFSISISMVSVFLLVISSGKREREFVLLKPSTNIIECPAILAPYTPLMTAKEFKLKYGAEPLRTRKNIDNLSNSEINAIKSGIIRMRSLPYTNPTSYLYQSAIHGTTLPDNLQSWNMCHKPGEGVFFFAWHRMYLYFFERILRAKAGRSSLTLPYWNYHLNPALPAAYRDKSLGNPLYDPTRSVTINNGGSLPSSIMTAYNNAMNITAYYTFQSNLNSGPHGSVHITIGGNMGVISTSVKDPVFWLHHSNIDRMWEEWRSRCGGRANPTDTTWLNKTYTFFDETGTAVNIKGSQVVEIAGQLNYRYDDRPPVINCPSSRPATVTRQTLITKETAVEISGRRQQATLATEPSLGIDSFIRSQNRRTFSYRDRLTPERLVLVFEGIRIQQMPQGVVEVYLNLPAGSTPNPNGSNFAGLLDLFSAEHHANHTAPGQTEQPVELDVTKAAEALHLSANDLRNVEISFITRGPSLNNVEVPTQAQITIRRIRVVVDRYR